MPPAAITGRIVDQVELIQDESDVLRQGCDFVDQDGQRGLQAAGLGGVDGPVFLLARR